MAYTFIKYSQTDMFIVRGNLSLTGKPPKYYEKVISVYDMVLYLL